MPNNRKEGGKLLEDDTTRTTHPDNIQDPQQKISNSGKLHVTMWSDASEPTSEGSNAAESNTEESNDEKKENTKWVIGIKAENIEIVPMINQFFTRTAVGATWLNFTEFG